MSKTFKDNKDSTKNNSNKGNIRIKEHELARELECDEDDELDLEHLEYDW